MQLCCLEIRQNCFAAVMEINNILELTVRPVFVRYCIKYFLWVLSAYDMYTCSYVSANPCKDWFCTYMHACKGSLLSKHQCMYFGGRSVNTHTINSQKYTCRSIRGRIPALVCIYVFEYSCTGRQPATYSYPNTRCRSHLNMYMRSYSLHVTAGCASVVVSC